VDQSDVSEDDVLETDEDTGDSTSVDDAENQPFSDSRCSDDNYDNE